ncbi:hypothetical protein [Allochromatium palmeri]|uniref:hypothetical protein n=1 Tax=Allochromatium palmeri TaxID=231048 RepID=UPI001FEB08D0|nr:hypothetical protein [Allochromatium palmeri]
MMTLIDETPGLRRYLTTALETSTGEDEQPLDERYTLDNFAPIALLQAHLDLTQACKLADGLVTDWPKYWDADQFAGDFWLNANNRSRRRSGCGFSIAMRTATSTMIPKVGRSIV